MFRKMGNGTTLNMARQPAQSKRTRPARLKIDIPLLVIVITLLVFGLLMVYSASNDFARVEYKNPSGVLIRQLIWALIGVIAAVILTFLDYHILRRFVLPAMITTIVLLILVLLLNQTRNNAVRTLILGSGQPSEIAKLVTIIYLAVWLYAKREQLNKVGFGLIPLGAILGIIGGLIFIQPDLSAVITIIFLGGMMFFLAGGDLKQIAVLVIVGFLVGWLIVSLNVTGNDRVTSYLIGLKDPTQASYHVRRAIESFVHGGWFGMGIGRGQTKLTGLPWPHTDSIFAVVGEETGLIGAIALSVLYLGLLWRGLAISRRAPDQLGSLIAAGLCLWIAFEAFINMAVIVNLLPFAGNALPFITYGGSNLLVTLASMGILLNISRQSTESQEENGRFFDAVVDLRRWNRRRRESSSRHSSGA